MVISVLLVHIYNKITRFILQHKHASVTSLYSTWGQFIRQRDLFLSSITGLLRKWTLLPWWRMGLCLKACQNSMSACIKTLYVGIKSRYSELSTDWTIWDSNPAGGELFSPSLKRTDWLCGLQIFLFSRYRGAPSQEDKGSGRVDYHSLHLALMFRMRGAISPIPLCLHGMGKGKPLSYL